LDLQDALDKAISLARDSGELLMRYFGNVNCIQFKGIGDIVTEADKRSEELIASGIKSAFPDHVILGEEFGLSRNGRGGDVEYLWAVDPLDGTSNYASGMPIFSVSISLLHRGSPVLGVVYDPNREWMIYAIEGQGAFLNGDRIGVNSRRSLSSVSLFGVSADVIASLPSFMAYLGKCRSLGSAALHICHVAMGIWDGCLDVKTHLWDVAAAALILQEAGGRFTDHNGRAYFPIPDRSPLLCGAEMPFLASNGLIHDEVLKLMGVR